MILDWFKEHIFKLSFIYFAICLYVLITLKPTFYDTVIYLGIPIIASLVMTLLEYLLHKVIEEPKNKFLTEKRITNSRIEIHLIFLHFTLFLFLFVDGFDPSCVFFNISFIITIVLLSRKFDTDGTMFKSRDS